jgi:site-specific DNA recombinase
VAVATPSGTLRKTALAEIGVGLCRAYLETILKNRFYLGTFVWQGIEYKGTHEPLIAADLFEQVQGVFAGRNKPKYRKHGIRVCWAAGLFSRRLYRHHRIAQRQVRLLPVLLRTRQVCSPYMPEQLVSERLGEVLKDIYVPETVVRGIVDSIASGRSRAEAERRERLAGIRQRLAALRTRMDQMYEDKLDGKIEEEFWARKITKWRTQERALESAAVVLNAPISESQPLTVQRTLELANKAHFLYLTRNHAEQG